MKKDRADKNKFLLLLILIVLMLISGIYFVFNNMQSLSTKSVEPQTSLEKKDKSINIFIKDSTPESDIQNLVQQIRSTKGVSKVTFVSQDEALEKYRELNKNNPEVLNIITKDILPASIEVEFSDISAKSVVVSLAKSEQFVKEIQE